MMRSLVLINAHTDNISCVNVCVCVCVWLIYVIWVTIIHGGRLYKLVVAANNHLVFK